MSVRDVRQRLQRRDVERGMLCGFLCRRPFYDKRMSAEVAADFLGDEWKVR